MWRTDGQTDGRTDGQIDILPRHSPRYAYAKTAQVAFNHGIYQSVLKLSQLGNFTASDVDHSLQRSACSPASLLMQPSGTMHPAEYNKQEAMRPRWPPRYAANYSC